MPKKKKEKKPKVKKEKKPKVKKEKEPKVKKEKKPKVKKVKTDRNIDYSAIQMLNVPESKLRDGFNPATGQYDTTQGKRVAPGKPDQLAASNKHRLVLSFPLKC